MEKTDKVYIVNKGGHDYSPAEEFGELVPLSEGKVNSFQVSRLYREFSYILKESSPNDYLLISGLPTLNVIAASILARKHGRIRILQYEPELGTYRKREIVIDNLIGEIKEPEGGWENG